MATTLVDQGNFVGSLLSAGYEVSQARSRAAVLSQADRLLDALTADDRDQAVAFLVPGRIEFLGKHTDYAGGRSLLCTVERGFGVVAVPRKDRTIRIVDPRGGPPVVFELDPQLQVTPGDWSNYAMTVARRIARNFPTALLGADIAFGSDLPPSAGMSSSSALMIGIYFVLAKANRLDESIIYRDNIKNIEDLAGYLGTVENGQSFRGMAGDLGVGTFGGSQDHTAILCSRPGVLRQYAFCPVRPERDIRIPADYTLAIASSGVISEKTGGARDAYNAVSASVTAIMKHWRHETGRRDATLADAVRCRPGAADELRTMLGRYNANGFPAARLIDRLDQFQFEAEQIIPAAAAALADGKIDQLGALVDRSQDLSERLLRNQVPETIFLASSARECGASAASAFGAGFGGSVWALIRKSRADAFPAAWEDLYTRQYPEPAQRATFFLTAAGRAACEIAYR